MSLPNPKWLLLEGLRFGASAVDYLTAGVHFKDLPPGEGQPVYLLPGLATNEVSTIFISRILRKLGYDAHDWAHGWNVRFNEDLVEHLKKDINTLYNYHQGKKVSIIGVSLGGMYARFLANHDPNKVRQIITLGSPFTGREPIVTYGSYLYDFLNKDQNSHKLLEKYGGLIHANPPLPSTSIYSKSDGVVHWKYSLQNETELSENIQVHSSHLGLACDPRVIEIIADRLSQPENNWQRYEDK